MKRNVLLMMFVGIASVSFAQAVYDYKYKVQVYDVSVEQKEDREDVYLGFKTETVSDEAVKQLLGETEGRPLFVFPMIPHEIIYQADLHPYEIEVSNGDSKDTVVEAVGIWFRMETQVFEENSTIEMTMFLSSKTPSTCNGQACVGTREGEVRETVKIKQWVKVQIAEDRFLVLRFLPPEEPAKAEMLRDFINRYEISKLRMERGI